MAKSSTKEENAVAVRPSALPVVASEYQEFEAQGFENTTAADITLPFFNLLQALSPQVNGPENERVAGAKPGLLHNTVTGQVYDAVEFVPCYHEHVFVEWKPRKQGGGFVARHGIDSEIVAKAKAASQKFGKYSTPEGNDLIETTYLYGVALIDGREEPAVFSFTSTKLKIFRNWWTRVNMFTLGTESGGKVRPPVFAHRVRISSKSQTNKEGTFFNLVVQAAEKDDVKLSLLSPSDSRFQAAKALRELVAAGGVKLDEKAQQPADAVPDAF